MKSHVEMSREQELYLIELGLRVLLDKARRGNDPISHRPRVPHVGRPKKQKWSDSQRKKFAATMKKKWDTIRKEREKE